MAKLSEEYAGFLSKWSETVMPAIQRTIDALDGIGALPSGMEFIGEPPLIVEDKYTKRPTIRVRYTYHSWGEDSMDEFIAPLEILDETDYDKIREIFKRYTEEFEENVKRELEEAEKRRKEQAKEAAKRKAKLRVKQEKAKLAELIKKYGIPKEVEDFDEN